MQSLAHCRAAASLTVSYRYYLGFCSSELASEILIPMSFSCSSRIQAVSHPYQSLIPRWRTSLFQLFCMPRTANLWNTLPISVFSTAYNFPVFKTKVNKLNPT